MKKITFLVFFTTLSFLLAQTNEDESSGNDGCGQAGIITITSSNGPFTGMVNAQNDGFSIEEDKDWWAIAQGSSGTITVPTEVDGYPFFEAYAQVIAFAKGTCDDERNESWPITLDPTRDNYIIIYTPSLSASYSFTVNGGIVLPVELTAFSAMQFDNDIKLIWETATEVNNYGFDIEKYTYDETWDKIGFVEGHGNSNSPKQYAFVDETVYGAPKYRLKQIDTDGKFEYSNIVEVENQAIESYNLTQNFPNPFNPSTTLKYEIPKESYITLKVYDILGREVATLVNREQKAGYYEIDWNGVNNSSGVYFYRIQAGDFVETKKMVLMK